MNVVIFGDKYDLNMIILKGALRGKFYKKLDTFLFEVVASDVLSWCI